MDNIKDDSYYIQKIITDVDFIISNTQSITVEEFSLNEILQDSMVFRLIQICENSHRISDSYKDKRKDIPWKNISGLRNRIVHDYGNVDFTIVFDTLTEDIPDLKKLFER